MSENATDLNGGQAVGSVEKESTGLMDVSRLKCEGSSKHCLNIAVVRPLPRSASSEMSPNPPQSPPTSSFSSNTDDISSQQIRPTSRSNRTRMCPFSFDLRDSMQRVAREQRLEALRLMEESCLTEFRFKANPVRKYKPLVLKQSPRQLTIPRLPFSSGDP